MTGVLPTADEPVGRRATPPAGGSVAPYLRGRERIEMAITAGDDPRAARLDELPVRPVHRKLVALVGLGLFFDLYELFLAGPSPAC